ncbi:MAG: hypothetical protein HY696_05095 [Deltaproteobacteria bacterium]|nr:hypothetical protein [Deltaproteobacteria bacterium]
MGSPTIAAVATAVQRLIPAAPPTDAASNRHEVAASGFDTLRIAQEEGRTTITGTDNKKITVTYTRRQGSARCNPQFINAGSTFRIVTHASGEDCAVDMDVTMPRQFKLRAGVAAGELTLRNLDGDVRLEVGAGLVHGIVRSPRTEIELATGQVNLEWSRLPNPGAVNFEAAAGTINLTLPKGSDADVQLRRTPVVSRTVKVTERANAGFKIHGKMAFGAFAVLEK